MCVHELAQEHGKTLKGDAEGETTVPFSVKSVSVQSVTMSEFFFRCSTDFPQVEYGSKKDKDCVRLWYEAYEMLESLSLLGCPGDRARSAAVNPHASTLNTLIQRGKTKRATRTSTTYQGNSSQHISLSILANAHSKIIAMERGLQGQHTAATKERFLLCVDDSVARHDALPQSMLDTDPNLPNWTWLPLTPLQAAIFGWTDLVGNPGYFKDKVGAADEEPGEEGFPMALPDGVPSRVRFVAVPGGQVGCPKFTCSINVLWVATICLRYDECRVHYFHCRRRFVLADRVPHFWSLAHARPHQTFAGWSTACDGLLPHQATPCPCHGRGCSKDAAGPPSLQRAESSFSIAKLVNFWCPPRLPQSVIMFFFARQPSCSKRPC